MSKPFFVTMQTRGKDPQLWIREINDKIHFEFQERLLELGEETAVRMGDIIRSSIKRPGSTGTLENSIKAEILNSVGGITIGIGRISDMPPYWEVINDGGYVPPANIGTFESGEPKKGASGEEWFHTGGQEQVYGFERLYYINPKKPIEPVKYIDIASTELIAKINEAVDNLMNEIEQSGK